MHMAVEMPPCPFGYTWVRVDQNPLPAASERGDQGIIEAFRPKDAEE